MKETECLVKNPQPDEVGDHTAQESATINVTKFDPMGAFKDWMDSRYDILPSGEAGRISPRNVGRVGLIDRSPASPID